MWQLVSEASVTITFICLLREYLIVKAKVEPDVSFLRTAVLLLLDDLTLFVTKAKLDRSSVNLDNRHSNHPAVEHNPGGQGSRKRPAISASFCTQRALVLLLDVFSPHPLQAPRCFCRFSPRLEDANAR